MRHRRNMLTVFLCMAIMFGILIGMCGCDLLEALENREWQQVDFDFQACVYSSYTGKPIPGAHVYLRAQKYGYEDRERIPGTDIAVERQIFADGIGEWKFDYKVLYDRQEKRYLEYVVVNIYAKYASLSGHTAASNAGYIKIYPAGGGWSSLKFSERSGSTNFNRKIAVRVPLKAISILD